MESLGGLNDILIDIKFLNWRTIADSILERRDKEHVYFDQLFYTFNGIRISWYGSASLEAAYMGHPVLTGELFSQDYDPDVPFFQIREDSIKEDIHNALRHLSDFDNYSCL